MKLALAAALAMVAIPCLAQKFDAASVKLSSDVPDARFGYNSDPGRIHYGGAPMIQLLMAAFDAKSDEIAGPAWMADFMGPSRYVVDATMPPGTTKEELRAMLRNLLMERFHLAFHRETRNFPGYELVVAKGGAKLKESTPAPAASTPTAPVSDGRAGGPPAPPRFGKDGFVELPPGPQWTANIGSGAYREKDQEQSIADFVGRLSLVMAQALGDELPADMMKPKPRVVDRTGLTGKYDFTVAFSCVGCLGFREMAPNLPVVAAHAGDAPPATASDPVGGGLPTIFSAFQSQLGLELVKVKDAPVEVIVIDRIDKVPVEN
jgi:uncharacterized protein (TIGR03435 family)